MRLFSLAGRKAAGPIAALSLLLSLGCLTHLSGPAGAQMGHVHQWTADDPPTGSFVARHYNGSIVTAQSPAQPCEILILDVNIPYDYDRCTVPGCQYNDGFVIDNAVVAKAWKDGTTGGENPSHFVTPLPDGHANNNEYTGEDGNQWAGEGNRKYYRIARMPGEFPPRDGQEIPDPGIDIKLDDSGSPFDDDPVWYTGAIAIPVEGAKCYVPKGRGPVARDCSNCSDASAQPANSSITPLNGDVSFTVPVTSWAYRGEEIDFSLTYHSRSAQDPRRDFNQIRHPAGISDRNDRWDHNPKWTHNFAQWLEVQEDGTAVWNRGDGTQLSFAVTWNGSVPSWKSGESYHTLAATGQLESPQIKVDDDWTSVETPYASFILKDGDGTVYTFDRVKWNLSSTPERFNHFAIPYFLLTRIQDRWGRNLTLNWDDEKGVTSVVDGAGRSLTFQYNGDKVLTGVTDPYGRSHAFGHTNYVSGSGAAQPRLTTIDVQGPGGTTHHWQFSYGGQFKDLITCKVEPSGRAVYYEYETVDAQRLNASDWDGRVTRTYYVDDLVLPFVTREITRSGTSLTYPGGDTYSFTYDGQRLASITHVPTNASVYYTWDNYGNLTQFRTSADAGPLVSLAYTYRSPSDPHIEAVAATDAMGRHVTTAFNDLNLPTQTTAFGVSNPNQVTLFQYDNGGTLTTGNLTQVTAAFGTASQESAALAYTSGLTPSLPTEVTDSLLRTSYANYHLTGDISTAAGPPNLLAPIGDPDRNPSTSALELNADDLPWRSTDPEGHQTEITYAAAPGSPEKLIVTVKHLADNSTRTVTLDGDGLPIKIVDEKGVITLIERNRAGQPIRVRAAQGTPEERLTTYEYNAYGRLSAFTPPGGIGGRVTFEYQRYTMWFPGMAPQLASPAVYEGQVTRVNYPDGTTEYFGYDGAEQPAWRYTQDGQKLTVGRDSLHRVIVLSSQGWGPATTLGNWTYDEFGRVSSQSNPNGTSTFTYDDLNRLKTCTPAIGNGFNVLYVPDPALKRWVTSLSVNGVGVYEFREDTKGRAAEVVNPYFQYAATRFSPDGKPVQDLLPNGTTTSYAYTPRDWLAAIEHKLANGTVLDHFDYFYTDGSGTYDPTGRLQREVDAGARTHAFTYNKHGELTAESHPDFGSRTFAYDANGNRTSWTQPGLGTVYAGYDGQNKLKWVNTANSQPFAGQANPYRLYTYDPKGRPTQLSRRDTAGSPSATDKFEWDQLDHLTRVADQPTNTERYKAWYDADGERVKSRYGGVDHVYTYGAGLLHDSASGGTVYTPGVGHRQGGVDHFYHSDWLGTTRYTTGSTGLASLSAQRFDAWGNVSASAGGQGGSLRWAGGHGYEADGPDGLSMLGARYYDPVVGRFVSPDPISFAGGMNLYAYCLSNPVGAVDPSGLEGAVFYGPNSDITWRGAVAQARRNQQWMRRNRGVKLLIDFTPPGIAAGVASSIVGEDLLTGEPLHPVQRGLGALSAVPGEKVLAAIGKGTLSGASQTACGVLQGVANSALRPGRLGGVAHRNLCEEIELGLVAAGYRDVQRETFLRFWWRPRGRFADVSGINPHTNRREYFQVGKVDSTGMPVRREADALSDMIGLDVTFVPYN